MTSILTNDNSGARHCVVVLPLKGLQHATTASVHDAKRCLQQMQQTKQQNR